MDRFDIVIVGGGMAGLSAALYGGWFGRSVLLVEREVMGGQILNAEWTQILKDTLWST